MADKRFAECYNEHFLADWDEVARFPKPIIAAVNGYAVCLLAFFILFHLIVITFI